MLTLLGLRSPRRYSPYERRSPYRKLSRDFTFGSSGSGDLESAQPTITTCTSCGRPSPAGNIFLDSSIQASNISEPESETRPAVRNLREPEEDDQEKEMTFPGAYPIEQVVYALEARPAFRDLREPEEDQEREMTFPGAYPIEHVVYALDEPAKLTASNFVKVAQKNRFETEVLPCPTVQPSAQYGFKELFFGFFAYILDL
jgi:hypothetical protein